MLKPLAVLAFAALAAPAALACSCMPCEDKQSLAEMDYVSGLFVGELLSVRKPMSGNFPAETDGGFEYPAELIYLFKVTRSIKGDMPKYVIVRSASNSAACGVDFSFEGLNAVAVTTGENDHYRSGMCTQMCWGAEPNRSLITEETMQTWQRDPRLGEE